MASSNPKNVEDTKSVKHDNNSDDTTFVAPKPDPKPNSQHYGREEQPVSKVEEALRFLQSVFEAGGSSSNDKGILRYFF